MKNYFCPKCKIDLIIGKEEKYETIVEHISCPNVQSPERETYICPNEDCEFHNTVFWDMLGDFYIYSNDNHSSKLYEQNKIDIDDRKTFKNCGVYAGGSYMYNDTMKTIKNRDNFFWPIKQKIQKWYFRKIKNKISSYSIDLRLQHDPRYCLYRDEQSKWKFVLGQFLGNINPFKFNSLFSIFKNIKDFDTIFNNYAYHPYPWVRYKARYFLFINNYEYRWNKIIEEKNEQNKTRWA